MKTFTIRELFYNKKTVKRLTDCGETNLSVYIHITARTFMECRRRGGRKVRDRQTESAMKLSFRNGCISKTRTLDISMDMLIWKRAISMGTLLDKELQTTNEFWEEEGYPLQGMRLLTVCPMQSAQP